MRLVALSLCQFGLALGSSLNSISSLVFDLVLGPSLASRYALRSVLPQFPSDEQLYSQELSQLTLSGLGTLTADWKQRAHLLAQLSSLVTVNASTFPFSAGNISMPYGGQCLALNVVRCVDELARFCMLSAAQFDVLVFSAGSTAQGNLDDYDWYPLYDYTLASGTVVKVRKSLQHAYFASGAAVLVRALSSSTADERPLSRPSRRLT